MKKLPARYGMFLYGVIQAALTTGVATAIATHAMTGLGVEFFSHWTKTWLLAWLSMLPLVIGVSPLIRRAVLAVTDLPRDPATAGPARGAETVRSES